MLREKFQLCKRFSFFKKYTRMILYANVNSHFMKSVSWWWFWGFIRKGAVTAVYVEMNTESPALKGPGRC